MDPNGSEHETMCRAQRGRGSSLGDLLYEQSSSAKDDDVFVAVSEDISDGMSTLLWAMDNLAKDGSRLVIARVHSPTRAIHKLGLLNARRTKYLNMMKERADKNMDEYALTEMRQRKDLETHCDKVTIEMEDVAEGLVKLIALHGITKLVMGAAADQHYSEEMKTPKSKTALKLMETVAPSCKIWFTCNGHLICTSEMNDNLPAISPSPVQSKTTPSSVRRILSKIRSTALNNEASSKGYNSGTLVEGTDEESDKLRKVEMDLHSALQREKEMDEKNMRQRMEIEEAKRQRDKLVKRLRQKIKDASEETNGRRRAERDMLSAIQRAKELEELYHHEIRQRHTIEETLVRKTREIKETKIQCKAIYDKLHDAKEEKVMLEQRITEMKCAFEDHTQKMTTISCLLKELHEDIEKLQQERDAAVTAAEDHKQKLAASKYLLEELQEDKKKLQQERDATVTTAEDHKQKLAASKYLLKELQEDKKKLQQERDAASCFLIETKIQCETLNDELHDAKEQKVMLKQRITEMESAFDKLLKDIEKVQQERDAAVIAAEGHKQKLATSKYLLEDLQKDKEKLQQEREAAVTAAEELRQKNEQRISMSAEIFNTEFSAVELQQATRQFDKALKIGEGGFGCVYKGSLRSTTVAIKLLHPESLQGQSEFHQEVAVLGRVRHPNIVTLIGSSRETFGLVYEFLPNGSLEERLACTNNTPPLTWQVRTRIVAEMCSALTFLHSNKPHPVVHGDLKPDNILLDVNLVSKLGDFGLCRLLIQSNSYRTTTPRGTFAYMDPEFMSTGELTTQSDVYSFGIIILQLLTGRPPLKITEVVEDAMKKGRLHSIVDPSAGSWPFVQASQLANLGLRCAVMSRRGRPDLAREVWVVVEPLMKAASLRGRGATFAAASSDEASTPSDFLCPIFQEIMLDPHIAADGFTYEAAAIRAWLDTGHDTSPMTNMKLLHTVLTPNRGLRSMILEWQEQYQRRYCEEQSQLRSMIP